MKRIALFLLTNIGLLIVLGISMRLLGRSREGRCRLSLHLAGALLSSGGDRQLP